MNKPPYIVTDSSISIIWEGVPYTVAKDSINYASLKQALLKSEYDSIPSLLSVKKRIEDFTYNNITVKNGEVFYGNMRLNGVVVKKLLHLLEDGLQDASSILNFITKLMKNPSNNSVEQLYTFLNYRELPLTAEGNVIAYKGVQNDFYSRRGNKSTVVLSGTVNDSGQILNTIGSTIEVQRNSVDDNKDNYCSNGLHLGSYDYAKDWAGTDGRLLMVEFNPVDAVSVPTDCECQKMRVCKYKVIREIPQEKRSDESPFQNSVYDTSKEVNIDDTDSDINDSYQYSETTILAIKNYVETRCGNSIPPTLKQIQSRLKGIHITCQEIAEICENKLEFVVHRDDDLPLSNSEVTVD